MYISLNKEQWGEGGYHASRDFDDALVIMDYDSAGNVLAIEIVHPDIVHILTIEAGE